ncbi:MAG: 1,6-anhydro-N-acetylmuramyl-L-alanine amidase AmpD [Proteobacteria bacterium]|nr:1,6-anhydro-N-acetylmuramyl-L-alanine amidase AmpD [Burkholderiales bacterium]
MLDAAGRLRDATQVPSPNCDERPAGVTIDLLVVHSISLPPQVYGGNEIIDLFLNRLDPAGHPFFASLLGLRVSAHFLIRRDGGLVQFVPCAKRAWHAGVSNFQGRERCNDFSIGVELEGSDADRFEMAQYRRLAQLTHALRRRYPLDHIAGHAEIAPGRKTDPGPFFDWARYRSAITRR